MKNNDKSINDIATELKELSLIINTLAAHAKQNAGIKNIKYSQDFNTVCRHQQAETLKMKALETASDKAWNTLSETTNDWDNLANINFATAKFN
jgi:hypothetical protein